jgi:hypothetical protein
MCVYVIQSIQTRATSVSNVRVLFRLYSALKYETHLVILSQNNA